MVPLSAVALLLLATTVSLTSACPDYMLIAPKQLRPGLDYQPSLYYADADGAVQVEMKITEKNVTLVSQTKTQTSGTFELYTLTIPTSIEERKTYVLEVTGQRGNTVVFYNSTALTTFQLIVSMKTSMLFIQTDKGIYKPGSTIKFRVMSVTPDLLPNPETFDVSIKDPKGNKVKAWLGETLTAGVPVFSGQYELAPTNIEEGEWKIEVETELETQDVTVTVKRYVLPRFDVEIETPKVILFKNGYVDGEVISLYSYGKDVQGSVAIKLGKINQKTLIKEINGATSFTILFNDKDLEKWGCSPKHQLICTLPLTAEVTEDLSNTSQKTEIKIKLYKHSEKVTFNNPSTLLKPGLSYKGTITVSRQDGSMVNGIQGEVLVTEVRYTLQQLCERCYTNRRPIDREIITKTCYNTTCSSSESLHKNFTIPEHGVVTYEFDVPSNASSATIHAQYKNTNRVSHFVSSKFSSGNGQSLDLKSLTEAPVVGFDMVFRLRPSVAVSHAYVLVAAKGKIVYTARIPLSSMGVTVFNIAATADMAPMCSVVAFYIYELEVIADFVGVRVSGIFRNEVSNRFSLAQQDAGKDITLTVSAEPNSLVYIMAIDKTVLQMAEDNDITEEMVENELSAFGMKTGSGRAPIPPCCGEPGPRPEVLAKRKKRSFMPPWFPSFPGNTDKLLTDAGLIYLTDMHVFRQQDIRRRTPPTLATTLPPRTTTTFMTMPSFLPTTRWTTSGPVPSRPVDRTPQKQSPTAVVRRRFPETWMWISDIITGGNGQVTLDIKLPDTITTWIATSFAMHPTAGLGIADSPAEVIGFRQFFIYPNLPPSLIRGEAFALAVSVFNYLLGGVTVQATVQLSDAPEWYGITGSNSQTINVPNNGAATATFNLSPRKHGRMPIRILASTNAGGVTDAVVRYIRVFPEGKQITGSKNFLLKHSPETPQHVANHKIAMPQFIVTDSKYVKVTVTGNVMGPTIEGLEGLVQRPVGCGEQNMITLVPNIYVRDLLESTGKLTPELKEKTTRHIEHGIQRQMFFQRVDGSFSAFKARPSDPKDHGSSWLTSFVMQSFIESKPYATVDPQTLEKGMYFIIQNQQPDGLFKEPGRVIHKDMQGGTAGGLTKTMAAYMLITMLMARDHVTRSMVQAIGRTQALLEGNNPAAIDDVYSLAISAYALQLAGSSSANAFIARLNSLSINDGEGRHWEIPKPTPPTSGTKTYRHYSSGPSDVEMTAYVLKTYVLRNELVEGSMVMKWLAEQRNPSGGFHSTQDTVLALGAMTAFYKVTYNTVDLNVDVDIMIDGVTRQLNINEANAELVQAYEVDNPASNDVRIMSNGQGDIFVQISWSYYVDGNIEVVDIDHFIKPVAVSGRRKRAAKTGGVIDMELCLRLTDSVQDMPICEIDHPSGHILQMGTTDRYVDATEISTKTIFYFDQLPANYSSCSTFQFIKETHVENLKPANSLCYFYYQSGSGSSKAFTMTGDPPARPPLSLPVPETTPITTPRSVSSSTTPTRTASVPARFPIRFALINLFTPFFVVGFLLGNTV